MACTGKCTPRLPESSWWGHGQVWCLQPNKAQIFLEKFPCVMGLSRGWSVFGSWWCHVSWIAGPHWTLERKMQKLLHCLVMGQNVGRRHLPAVLPLYQISQKLLPSCQPLITGSWQGILSCHAAPDSTSFSWPSSQRYLLRLIRSWDSRRLPLTAMCRSSANILKTLGTECALLTVQPLGQS